MTAIINFWRSTKGTTAVEFALIAPIVLLLCFSTLEIGRAIYTRSELAYAIDLGARKVFLDPDITKQDLDEAINLGLTAALRTQVMIETGLVSDMQGTHRVLEARMPFSFIVPFVPQGAFILSVQRSVPMT